MRIDINPELATVVCVFHIGEKSTLLHIPGINTCRKNSHCVAYGGKLWIGSCCTYCVQTCSMCLRLLEIDLQMLFLLLPLNRMSKRTVNMKCTSMTWRRMSCLFAFELCLVGMNLHIHLQFTRNIPDSMIVTTSEEIRKVRCV